MTSSEGQLSPSCPHGYTTADLERVFGASLPAFHKWMDGQTQGVCEGRRYDHDLRRYFPTECADDPHGVVAYRYDVERYVRGARII